ncbi:MAG: hypothetical protein PVF47_00815 [Anaerolineae bacterium]|jgi:hypothetical protein
MNKTFRLSSLISLVTLLAVLLVTPTLFAQIDNPRLTMVSREHAAQMLTPNFQVRAGAPGLTLGITLDTGDITEDAPAINATRRISIPYGFESLLPVLEDGRAVLAGGHGGCTEDQQVTIAITITQSISTAVATGTTEQTCTGELQIWRMRAMADTTSSFADGPAEACGLATTRDAGYVTDTYDWCVDVDLIRLDHQIYLPLTAK